MSHEEPEQLLEEAIAADVEMDENAEGGEGERNVEFEVEVTVQEGDDQQPAEARTTFISHLMSPMVTLLIGKDEPITLSAHQSLLVRSPWFEEACRAFDDSGPRQINLPDEDVDAVGCFLEYLYTGEYFPRKLAGQRVLETDPALPELDEQGDQLLKHARVYTLADKFGVASLKTLAVSKIHCIHSSIRGEIQYARYVYAYTALDDDTIRKPVANFWATRSHTLRSEAEDEFKALCLEFPQFGYDVLTRVLDEKLRREKMEKMHPATSSTRKRPRHSSGAAAF